MQPWKRIEPTIKSKVGYRTIISKFFEMPSGRQHHFEIMDDEGVQTVAVIALTEDNKVLICRQFRPGPEKIMDEIPGGFLDPGEDKETAVKRELTEETGYRVGTLKYLGDMYNDAYTHIHRHYFLATGCTPSGKGLNLGEDEFVELIRITIPELIQNAKTGKMTDPAAVLMAYDHLTMLL